MVEMIVSVLWKLHAVMEGVGVINVGKSVKMPNKISHNNTKFIVWLFLNIAILVYGIYLRQIAPDGAIVFIYLMYLVSFPLGFAVPFVFVCMDMCVGYDINVHYSSFPIMIDILIPWVLFLIAGYLQWFMLIPKIKKYWKKRKSNA